MKILKVITLITLIISFFPAKGQQELSHTGTWSGTGSSFSSEAGCTVVTANSNDNPAVYITTTTTMGCDPSSFSHPSVFQLPSLNFVIQPHYTTAYNGQLSFSFSSPVDNPIIHLDRVGGYGTGGTNSILLTLQGGLTMTELSSSGPHFVVSDNEVHRAIGTVGASNTQCGDSICCMAGGSIQINGTNITNVVFNWEHIGPTGGDAFEIVWSVPYSGPAALNLTSNTPICVNDNLQLYGTSEANAVSWSWSGPNSFSSTNQNPLINNATLLNSGTYTVTSTDVDGCSSTGEINIEVNPSPMIAFDTQNNCTSQTTIDISLSSGTDPYVFSWTGPSNFSSESQNLTVYEAGVYSVTVTDANGCIASDEVDITISSSPSSNAGEDVVLCGYTYTLDASYQNGTHGQWIYVSGPQVAFLDDDAGTETIEGNPNAQIHVTSFGELILKWRAWNGECFTDDEVSISFYERAEISFSEESYSVCGLSANIQAISTVNPETSFQWINNNEPTLLLSSMNTSGTTASSIAYGEFDVQCVGTVGNCSDTADLLIGFYEIPIADAGVDKQPCGTLDSLHAHSIYGGYWTVSDEPDGDNCSAIFTNHLTGEPDIYDSLAVVSVTCEGEWSFTWHEVNGACQATDEVTINFLPHSIALTTLPEQKSCLDYTQVHVDTTGHSDKTWLWAVDQSWPYINEVPVSFSPYDPMTIVYKGFPETVFGDSGYVEIPMVVTLISEGCASTETSSVTFYQSPSPDLGEDTLVCNNEIDFNVTPTVPVGSSTQQWYGLGYGGTYTATPDDAYITTISAAYGDSLYIVFSEENDLGENGLGCVVYDSILIEFLKRPILDAGNDEYHNCGNCIQLEVSLDNSVNSVGRWLINSEGFFGYSCGDNNPAAVVDTNAWFYHSTDINPGVDTIYVTWLEYNAKSPQCFAVDSVPIHFWYQDTAYIKLNGNISLVDSTCGRAYYNISANDSMPTNAYSKGTWRSADGNPIEWYKNDLPGAHNEPELDYIKVSSIGDQAHVWRDIYWMIENGDIYGSDPAVCVDTSLTVSIRFDNPVVADILESGSYPEPLINCGDTLCLNAGSIDNWSHFRWSPNDYTYYREGYSTYVDNSFIGKADTLSNPCLIAPSNIYPNSDTITGGNTHETVYLSVFNGMCLDIDTINIRWAPIPSGIFFKEIPNCAEDSATLIINRDYLAGFDRFITDVEWFFEDGDEPTKIIPYNSTNDTIAAWWGNSIENNDFNHAVSVKTKNIWGCEYRIYPPDTVFAPLPSYVNWVDNENPICGECDGELSFMNYSDEYPSPLSYSVEWASNSDFNNSEDNIIAAGDTIYLDELCANEYYLKVSYQSVIQGNCSDTLYINLHADSSTIATSNYEFLVDTTDLQAPFELSNMSINNTSVNANKYTWQVFNGTEEDLSMLVYEGNEDIPDYIFSNMGQYLVKLQAFNDKAPNCPASPVDMTIFVHYESVLEVPNIFTPNNDGYNDEFRVKARELATYKCFIYNRWGQKVFETDDFTESWNGKMKNDGGDLSAGAYYYVITGTGKKGQEFEFKGAIQLMKDN